MQRPLDDRILLNSLKKGDQAVMQVIFDTHYNRLCSLAHRITRDRDQAKDVVQNVFIKLWGRRKSLEIEGSLESYLKRAVFNTALNSIEQTNLQRQQSTIQAPVNTTERDILYAELSRHVDEAIDQLPVRTRAVFTLIRYEEMSYLEVAATLEISRKAVEKEMMKALRLLRESLKPFLLLILVILTSS